MDILARAGFDLGGAGGQASGGGGGGAHAGFIIASEAERMIEQLKTFGIEDVGSPAWTTQREALERLNVQAHHNAVTYSDEFVKEMLISHDKVGVLVHELLVIEAWKEKVFPHFGAAALDQGMTNMNAYLAHYFEATVCNLLEIAFFHQDACEAAGEDALLELTDYCNRKLLYLNTEAKKDAEFRETSAKEMVDMKPSAEFEVKEREIRFGTACCALTILRYLTDYINQVPLCVMARLLDTHDSVMLLVPLLEERPWVRRRKPNGGAAGAKPITEVFSDGRWSEQVREDRLQLTKCDGQVWLAVNNLTVDAKCRAKYRYDDHRKGVMERLKRFFNDVLFDQLPVLKDLQRVMDEIILMATPSSHEITQGRLILEVVPETRTALLNRSEAAWVSMAKEHLRTYFADTPEARKAAADRMEGMSKMFEFMCELDENKKAAETVRKPEPPPPDGVVRVDFSRQAEDGQWYRWHCYDMKLDAVKGPKQVELSLDDGYTMQGDQHRLLPPAPTAHKPAHSAAAQAAQDAAKAASESTPVPHNGKVTATYGRNRAEALLDLPAPGRMHADVYGGGVSGVAG
eukprot:CAMPEP_0197611384 /NCGR_PEP_ID=MMETSP1326-20131121/55248_1 /TAXON_ID=1155430 /ORGANISM="Genus nov. species nov., Strain RCC2288" /LENGTH=573 /DNA_ID=CAMNT_0043180021 /DNA_START=209 /DNA_END=1926 /DNA_ORIENTATION=-